MSTNKSYNLEDFLDINTVIPKDANRFERKFSEVDLLKAYNRNNTNILKAQQELVEAQIEIKNHQEAINKQQRDINRHDDGIRSTKNFLWVVLLILVVTIVTWFVETFWKFSEVKQDYIIKTEELNSKITIYEKENSDLKEELKNLKEDFSKNISNEVELQLLRKQYSKNTGG